MKQLVIRVLKGGSSIIHVFSIHLFIHKAFIGGLLQACSVLGAGEQAVRKDTALPLQADSTEMYPYSV